ncbi:MAG: hypothetical protein IJS96_04395 [Schwartzia sp.]|nr:hypothetical protein [Schwartzia sp. (in: firmicutes)]
MQENMQKEITGGMAVGKSSNPWTEYYAAKSESEKEVVLKKILPDITSEELEIMRRKLPMPN